MKTNSILPLVVAIVLATLIRAVAQEPLPVAVFDFESKDEAVHDMGPKVATLVNARLSADPNLATVERAELEKMLGEQELGLSGTVSTETAAKVGQLTGAKVLVTGRVFKDDRDLTIVAKIIGTETIRVYGEIVTGKASGSISELSAQLAKQIGTNIAEHTSNLVAKVVSREERIDKILKSLKEGKRPSVSIRLPESHFGTPVIDPAAETELAFILKKAGFTIVDDKSDQKPDIEITGQAFSAYGVRIRSLVSCRSRVEVKIQERVGGKILGQDSETSVAVDIAEQTAAKTALMNAADGLAARIVPLMAQ